MVFRLNHVELEDVAERDELIDLHFPVTVKGLPESLVLDAGAPCQLGDVLAALRADLVNPYRY